MKLTAQLMTLVRWLLGAQMLLSGLNWWIKMFPFPNKFDAPGGFMKDQVVRAMIDTGWMFELAKIIEVAAGLSFLLNLFVPLMLVVSFTVSVSAFLIDAFFLESIEAVISGEAPLSLIGTELLDLMFWGGAVFLMHVFLLFGYLHCYMPMLVLKGRYRDGEPPEYRIWDPGLVSRHPRWQKPLLVLGVFALVFGGISTVWLALMVKQWALPWTTLRILVPGLI